MRKVEEVIKRLNITKQDTPVVYPAKLGDGNGKVIAGTGLVYVRVADIVSTAACTNTPLINDLDVWVGYDSVQRNILRVIGQRNTVSAHDYTPDVAAHAAMHEFMGDGPLGGTDVVKVRLQQFTPLAVWPYDNNMKVVIYPGIVWLNGRYQLIADVNPYGKPVPKVIDFGGYPAPDDGKEMYYLIGIDINGNVKVIGGSQVDVGTLTLAHIPEPLPSDNVLYCLAAVRRTRNMSIVLNRETADIVDLRFPMQHTHGVSSGGGGGAVNRVVAEDLVIQAGYGIIYPEWVEVSDGYSIEIADNAVLEVT